MNEEIAVLFSVERLETTVRHRRGFVKKAIHSVGEENLMHVGGVVWKQFQWPVFYERLLFDVNDGADGMCEVPVGVRCQLRPSFVRSNPIRRGVIETRHPAPLRERARQPRS
jgi:hypothetical protein